MKIPTGLLLVFFAFSALADTSTNSDKSVEILRMESKAELLKLDQPIYPQRALRHGTEGWVVIRLVIKPDGTTEDIEVVDSSIENYFEDAALKSARTRVYKPAMSEGKPIMQGNVHVRSIFQFSNADGGVSKPFLNSYRKASRAITEDNLELAKTLIDKLDDSEKRLLAEVCYLDMLKAQYFAKTGAARKTLLHVERALVIADDVASKPIYLNLLRQAIVDNALANNFQSSLEHYNSLLEVDKKLESEDPIHTYVKRIEDILGGDKPIFTSAEFSRVCKTCDHPRNFWRHTLNRNQFSFDMVEGELHEIEIICQNSLVSVAYDTDMSWTVNRDAGECGIKVFGDKNSSFRLVELPDKS
jgi:TonB family protein